MINIDILIIGLGIGKVYVSECNKLNLSYITVDSDIHKNPNFYDLDYILKNNYNFKLGIICLPNYLHYEYANKIKNICKNILVEKPGFKNYNIWKKFKEESSNSKLYLSVNNIYRNEIIDLKKLIKKNINNLLAINFYWENKNRIPFPGSWFTNKDLSYYGVSGDLMPHLLSFLYFLFDYNYINLKNFLIYKKQNNNLRDIIDTDYGSVNKLGIFDVDDFCTIDFNYFNLKIHLQTDWKNNNYNRRGIELEYQKGLKLFYDFDLCPNYCYGNMILDIIKEKNYNYHNSLDEFIITHIL
jgi:predicted dehydrogenase